jgi:hypothetical protein
MKESNMSLFEMLGDGLCAVGRGINFVVEDIIIEKGCGALDSAIDYATENPVKTIAMVGATVATGGLALAYAGPIAATVGATGVLGATATTGAEIALLSGAALESASLAAMAGGALSVGGAGMLGGTAVITTTGAVVGAGAGAGIVKATA